MTLGKSLWHLHPHVRSGSDLTFGERTADRVRDGMGSWAFIWIQTIIVVGWVIANIYLLSQPFDPYPFILLNLAFSTQAAYAAPIILLSARRSDAQASELAVSTHANGEKILALQQQNSTLTQQVLTLTEQQMTILAQQNEILAELRQLRQAPDAPGGSP